MNDYIDNMNNNIPPVAPTAPVQQPVYTAPVQQQVQQTVPVTPVQPTVNAFQQAYPQQAYQQPVNNQLQTDPVMQPQPVQPVQPVQDPNQIFGSTVISEQIAAQGNIQVSPLLQKHEEEAEPKYGAATEGQADLNEDKNGSLKFVIILGILVLAFIIFLPYLSDLFSSVMGSVF